MPRSVIAGFAGLLSGLALAAAPLVAQAQEQTLDQSVSTQNKIVEKAAATQDRINNLSQQTQDLLSQYLITKHQVARMKQYNEHLQAEVNDQESRIDSLKYQLTQISKIEHGIIPLMDQMIGGLGNFVKLDMPFHRQKRLARVHKLKDLMTNSDVTISEKYRQIMAAYKAEIDYGKTVGSYRARISVNGQKQTVNFLRIGRIVLCYQTLNQSQTACWNSQKGKWVVNNGYRRNVAHAISVALKQTTPSLLLLPVVAPQQPLNIHEITPLVSPAGTPLNAQRTAAPQAGSASQS